MLRLVAVVPVPVRATLCVPFVVELLAITSVPVAAPVAAGVNCTFTVADCPGLRVAGRLMPPNVNAAPAIVILLTVTGSVPVELSVTVLVDVAFSVCVPKARLLVFRVTAEVAAFNCSANVAVPFADSVAVCVVSTAVTTAANEADVAPEDTVTDAGTVTAVSLLVTCTLWPPVGAGALNVTVHASLPAPVMDALAQASLVTVGVSAAPLPFKPTDVDFLLLLFELDSLSVADAAPTAFGENCTFSVVLAPAARVIGSVVLAVTENWLSVTARSVISSASVPGLVTVTVERAREPTVTAPNVTESGAAESVASAAEVDDWLTTYAPQPFRMSTPKIRPALRQTFKAPLPPALLIPAGDTARIVPAEEHEYIVITSNTLVLFRIYPDLSR